MIGAASKATLGELFGYLAARRGDAVALRDPEGRALTYGMFQDRVRKLCAAVASRGVSKGARVAVLAKNSVAYAEVFGLVQLGMVVVPLNWRLGPDALGDLLADCAPEILIVDRAHYEVIRNHAATLGSLKLTMCFDGPEPGFAGYEAVLNEDHPPAVPPAVGPDDAASIVYTSGTTGRPKGAVITHRGALANMAMSQANLLQLGEGDRVLAAMPFFHVGGLWYHFFASFAAGCETTVLPEFDPVAVLAALRRDRITVVHLVPTMVSALLGHQAFRPEDLRDLRRVFYAGSPMPTSLLRRAIAALETCEFLQSYGSTEAGIVSALTPAHHAEALRDDGRLLRSCGIPVQGCEVRIACKDGTSRPGQVGEIEVRGDAVFHGYWQRPDATAEVRAGDWVRTGDLGYLDAEGFLFLVDRKNDMIITGGENVFPTEVEDHLMRQDGVAEAAVFGTPHPRWIEQVTAVIVPVAGHVVDIDSLRESLRRDLAHYKCPKEIFIADGLPKNGVGKVVRARLREIYSTLEGGLQ
ncbi:MAG: class I adenylate-forming enzyme family protein [Hyphomonas sp.]